MTATYTVKLCMNRGVGPTLVVGVATNQIRDDVITYIATKGGKLTGDWYRFGESDDIDDVTVKANLKGLDDTALIYEVSGESVYNSGELLRCPGLLIQRLDLISTRQGNTPSSFMSPTVPTN